MRKLLALLTAFASPALAQTPAGVINAPIYATGYISQVGGTNVTTNIPPQPNHPTNLNIYTTGAISGTWTIKLPNPAFEGQMLSFNCGAAANAIAIVSSDGSSIDSNLPTSCITNGGFVAQFDLRSNIWRSLGSGYSANFRPFTGVTSQWPWQLNTDGTWTLKQPDAVDVTFTQSGTGSVTRNVQNKLRDVISILDFGASPSTTDNATAIQAAVNAVLAYPYGGAVYVPAPVSGGCYKVNTQVTIPKTSGKGVRLFGDGAASCFVNGSALDTTAMFYVGSGSAAGGSGFVARDIGFQGRTATTGKAFYLENANASELYGVHFDSMFQPVEMKDSYGVIFDHNQWNTIYGYSLYSSTAAHHTVFTKNKFFNTGVSGAETLRFDGATDNLIVRDNDAETGWNFLRMAGGSALTFSGNYLEYFSNIPFYMASTMYGAEISNNWFYQNGNLPLYNITGGRFANNRSANQVIANDASTLLVLKYGNTNTGTGSTVSDDAASLVNTTRQMISGNITGNLPSNATQYFLQTQSATENLIYWTAPRSGTFRNLYINVTNSPGAGQSYVFTLRVNGADTSVTCTISNSATSCNDTTHTAAITAGQTYSIKSVSSATATGTDPAWGVEFFN